jgi:ABC-2 type transport system permease protein
MNITAIKALIKNDIRLYFSDRRSVIVGVLVPICIAAFFGYVFSGGGRSDDAGKIPIGIVDEDQSTVSRAIAADFAQEKLVSVRSLDRAGALAEVRSGKLQAAVVLTKGFGEQTTQALFSARNKATVILLVDPSQATSARVVEGLLAQHAMQEVSKEAFSGSLGIKALDGYIVTLEEEEKAGRTVPAELKELLKSARRLNQIEHLVIHPASESGNSSDGRRGFGLSIPYALTSMEVTARDNTPYNSYAHSFAGMTVQFILFAGIDAGILLLLTRERGIWQRLRSAPLRKSEFVIARMLATALISLFQLVLIYLAAMLIFKVRIQGSVAGFAAIAIALCLLNAAFGLMLATLGRSAPTTRGMATMVTLLLVMIGGAWVPAFVFPSWLQQVSYASPTRWAVDGLDAMTWRGLPFASAWLPATVLLTAAIVCIGIAIWRFRWDE